MNIVPRDNYQYGTDYAKCQGLDSFLSVQNSAAYKTVDCWTRTAYFSGKSGNFAWQVSYNGEVNSATLVRTTTLGVRPCLWLDLM